MPRPHQTTTSSGSEDMSLHPRELYLTVQRFTFLIKSFPTVIFRFSSTPQTLWLEIGRRSPPVSGHCSSRRARNAVASSPAVRAEEDVHQE